MSRRTSNLKRAIELIDLANEITNLVCNFKKEQQMIIDNKTINRLNFAAKTGLQLSEAVGMGILSEETALEVFEKMNSNIFK